jgi:GNAT superfamily N-acetyltransferase
MTDLTNIKLQEDHTGVNWRELEGLFTLTDLSGRKGDKLRRAFLNSQAVCYAFNGDRLVGCARAITDGEYHAFIYDVVVHPDYQRQGLGKRIMRNLLDRLPVWRVMLVADHDVQPFYQGFGFGPYPDVMAQLNWDRLFDATDRSES